MTTELELLVMAGWNVDPRRNPPPDGVIVEITGNDCFGTWLATAMRKDYRPGSSKKQLKRKWRWCHADGSVFEDQAVAAWRNIKP